MSYERKQSLKFATSDAGSTFNPIRSINARNKNDSYLNNKLGFKALHANTLDTGTSKNSSNSRPTKSTFGVVVVDVDVEVVVELLGDKDKSIIRNSRMNIRIHVNLFYFDLPIIAR